MDIWIIEDGEKSGPFPDYDIRDRIESGSLPGDTPGWHEGLDAWKPLREIPVFKTEFDQPFTSDTPDETHPVSSPTQEPAEKTTTQSAAPPPLESNSPVRRFWARWFDLFLFSGFWWLGMWAVGRDIEAILTNPWIMLLQYVPWFVLEAWLIHRFGATPGKWLLGLRVANDDGSLLTLGQATLRSVRVLFIGIGFGWGILSVICQGMSVFTLRRLGRPVWDHAGGHRVSANHFEPVRIAIFVIVMFASLQLQGLVVNPYTSKQLEKQFPQLQEFLEKHPLPRLPERG